MTDMNQLLFLQEDTFNKINKGYTNTKKSPKSRLTKEFIEAKLETLENLWKLFSETHTKLCKSADAKLLIETPYWKQDVWDTTSDTYTEYKCWLKTSLPKDVEPSATPTPTQDCHQPTQGASHNLAKLPKIVIPKFNGQYQEWNTFRDLFISLVHDTKIDKVVKLQYLKGLLGGEAEQLVRHISIAADNYDRCWAALTERYNNKRFLCNTILKRLFSQKSSNSESASFLKEILDNTTECLGALANQGVDVSTWDLIVIYMTSLKLDPETRKQWELQSADCGEEELPSFKEFQVFLTKRFRALEFVGTGTSSNKSKTSVKSFHASQDSSSSASCKFCKEEHKLVHCEKFETEEVSARRMFVEKNRLCYNCLGDGHSANHCRCRVNCRVCRRRHHTLLHATGDDSKESKSVESDPPKESDSGEAPVVCFASGDASISGQVLLATALVKAQTENGDTRIVRALLDQGSQASFITEATAQLLRLKRTPVQGIVSGVGGSQTLAFKSKVKVNIASMRDGFEDKGMTLDVFVLKSITTLLPSTRTVSTGWVSVLPLADPKYYAPGKIDLLLGAEVVGQVMRGGVKREGQLLAQNTTLGWILSGVVGSKQEREATNLITLHQMCHGGTEEDYQLKKFWELEADTHTNKKSILTEEEKQCEKLFAETTTRDPEGRYIVKLPFRDDDPEIKTYNSKRIAEKRLTFLKAKLDKAEDLKAKYKEVLEEYLQLGHMEEVPKEEVSVAEGSYLPHFAVVRDDKDTTKVRIVFDASCKGEDGISLNDKMMVGPTLQPELRNLLMRWRLHRICLSADIIKMYRQVKVASSDVDYQRILWKEDQPQTASLTTTNTKSLKEFRLLRVTFGTASAPYLAVKVLQQVAYDEGSNYPTAAEKVKQDFYMDDLLTGCQDIESAKQLYNEMNSLLEKGGFKLQKWSSNSELFLESIKETRQGSEHEDGLKLKVDDIMKLLGLTWNRRDDAFQYTVTLPQLKEPVTKRRVISDIARLFDPLGWVAPTVIVAKIIIQKLWILGTDWDEEVPSTILKEWLTYRNQLPTLSEMRIPRWIQISPENRIVELHGFSDASKLAYAAVVYLRIVDENGDIHVNLVTAKTKVAPIKQVSIPRLELCGAVLVARLLLDVAETLNVDKRNLQAWTDSTVVLAWLNSHPNRWQTFVANRVSEILTTLDSHQWSHISTKHNPADGASRGLQPSELLENTIWLSGPDILKSKEVKYDRKKDEETNLEENTVHKIHLVTKLEIWDKFSNLRKMIRVIAYCRRFMTWKQRKQSKAEGFLTTQELNEAMEVCIKKCQQENFEEELASIAKSRDGKLIKLKSPFKALNPYVDDKQILRVGGRLEMSALSDDRKHPILLPKKSDLTNLLVSDAHTKTLHGGPQLMLTYLRSKFWIFGAKDLVRAYVRQCVKCTRYRAVTSNQLMGQLPAARVRPMRAFKHSGLDYAGPINIRTSKGRGQHSYKGYICLFVCMSTKAVHLEVVSDMTTEGFLAAFKRFVSRRGFCSDIWSDNGTGFVGASRQLPKMVAAEQATMSEIATSLAGNGTTWHFIPPLSPNFGGLWEAGVKSVKFHLKRVIGDSTLTYEELATVLGQIEACLNSRPLLRVDTESEGYEALTPGHFLVGEPLLTVPDHSFENVNMGSLRRWQLTQKMTQDFWRRWSDEYLTSLIHRYKWSFQNPEPQIGDLVLIKEDGLPPSRWLLGRVITKHPGPDNITRVVSLRTKSNIIKRPTSKLCILPIAK